MKRRQFIKGAVAASACLTLPVTLKLSIPMLL